MKLQVGCSNVQGRYKQPEWVNLDIVMQDGVDVVADASENIPFPTNTFDAIHCIHVLEHVKRDKYQPMLREMYRVLKPGCVLWVETPDFRGTIAKLQQALEHTDMRAIHIWTTSVYGKNERSGMAHHWGFYEALLCDEFRNQGFQDVQRETEIDNMISTHYKQEPVLLMRGTK